MRVNGDGAGMSPRPLRSLTFRCFIFQPITSSTARLIVPTARTTRPPRAPMGARNSKARIACSRRIRIALCCARLGFTVPFGANFVARCSAGRNTRGTRGCRRPIGNPTSALDIADAILDFGTHELGCIERIARRFSYDGTGEASWADFAEAIFAEAEKHGRAPVRVKRITTADYPTPAKRPANSRLDNSKLQESWSVVAPLERLDFGLRRRLLTRPN